MRVFGEVAVWVYEQSGIEVPADTHRFEIYRNPRGQDSVLQFRRDASSESG